MEDKSQHFSILDIVLGRLLSRISGMSQNFGRKYHGISQILLESFRNFQSIEAEINVLTSNFNQYENLMHRDNTRTFEPKFIEVFQ